MQEVVGSNPSIGYWIKNFPHINCCKNCNVCLKRPKINEKEAGVGPFFKKYSNRFPIVSSYLLHTSCPRYSLVVFATEPVHSVPNTYHQPQNINLNLKLMHVA